MALVKCTDCGKPMSNTARVCLYCGYTRNGECRWCKHFGGEKGAIMGRCRAADRVDFVFSDKSVCPGVLKRPFFDVFDFVAEQIAAAEKAQKEKAEEEKIEADMQ